MPTSKNKSELLCRLPEGVMSELFRERRPMMSRVREAKKQ
jgi:hypothetical protein